MKLSRYHMCFTNRGLDEMDMEKKKALTLRKIFRYMMEKGHEPSFETTHILFGIEENTAVLEYEDGFLAIRLFFSIDKDEFRNFLEASNACMQRAYMIRPVILEDHRTIMFSCECICDTFRDFERFFPKMLETLQEGLSVHKDQMKELLLWQSLVQQHATQHS